MKINNMEILDEDVIRIFDIIQETMDSLRNEKDLAQFHDRLAVCRKLYQDTYGRKDFPEKLFIAVSLAYCMGRCDERESQEEGE